MSSKPIEMNREEDEPAPAWERQVRRAVKALRYGSVEVLVHDGRVVQVETREKVRFADDRPADGRRRNLDEQGGSDRQTGGAPEDTKR
jgi:hypothetical protein